MRAIAKWIVVFMNGRRFQVNVKNFEVLQFS
jgi:hypothetical protein